MTSDPFQLPNQTAHLGRYRAGAARALARLAREDFLRRLWQKDASLWSSEPAVQAKIAKRLGWLTSPDHFQQELDRIRHFVRRLQQAGFTHALVLGMGGSSMCPEVCRTTFGVAPGFLDLLVLDTTDPATIRAREQAVDLPRTLFIVSSKSGTTTETISLYSYFYHRLRALKGAAAGENFIAITDAGTPLAQQAAERGFRDCFLNPADIGGRFSALSFFGLVPAALVGIDPDAFLARAQQMARACSPDVPIEQNPGVVLGAILAHLYAQGCDKLTFVLAPPIASFGYWVEQLVAESLGKIGKGIVPIEGEPLGSPSVYGRDRVFAHLTVAPAVAPASRRWQAGGTRVSPVVGRWHPRLAGVASAGHPTIEITLRDKLDLAAEFYRWEIATAAAGALMQLNPFDEPNVQESKDNTDRLLRDFCTSGRLPEPAPTLSEGPLRVFVPAALEKRVAPRRRRLAPPARFASRRAGNPLAALLTKFLRLARRGGLARPGDYFGLSAYFQATKEHHRALQAIRLRLCDLRRRPVTLGYGPRFLHSTGQLHKGGPNTGLYFQLVATDTVDAHVPGQPYTFSTLKQAQALGDFAALANKHRRTLRIHLGENIPASLAQLSRAIRQSAPAFTRIRVRGKPKPRRKKPRIRKTRPRQPKSRVVKKRARRPQ